MDLQQRKQQLKSLVKENFDCFVSCKNTIDDIHMKLQQIETDTEGAGTVHLSTSISQVNQLANGAFGPLFERQAQVERIRSVQGMLQRFRTLFNLPSTIQGHISKGDYDLAVREYKKAKSLVRVLERVLETVEKVISDFKDKMYKSMEDPNVEFSQLESIMQLLLELEPSSDPVWHYLKIQNVRIRSLLEACLVEHDERMEELHKHLWARAQLDARWKKIQQETNKASNVNVFSLFGGAKNELDVSVEESMAEQSDILLNRLIHRLTSVLSQQVPPFWRLSISIFNGKFTKVSQGEFPSAAGFEVFAGSEVNATFKGHPISEVVAMITDIANLYESKVLKSVTLDVHDLGSQINEIQAAVKLTAFECFSSLKDNLDKLALSVFQHCQELENKALNGGDIEKEGHFTGLQAGIAVANPHQRLLMVLSNTGYCRTGLVPVLLQKYKNIWVGDDSDSITVEKLMEAFSSLEESILGQYAQSKATLIGTAAAAFFLEDGLQWGAAPAVKGVRDAVVELLYPLIVVHAELTAGAKPYLRRAIPILIESLIDALVNVFNGSRQKALRVLDLNGFSQLALELGYLEGVLQTHFTAAALDAFSSLRNQLKEKALETIKEAEMLGRKKSGTRGGMEDASAAEERLQNLSVSTDELDALEQQVCSDFLQVELKRTKLIYMCFTNMSERSPQSSSRHSSGRPIGAGNATVGLRAPSGLQHQRFRSSSSLSDSDSSRPSGIPPYQSPMSQSGYASSDVGSETGVYETKLRSSVSTDRHVNIQGSNRRQSSRRAMFGATDDDFR
ncbi:hypothetical protein KP509_19G007800 [Ceratopteris richardii]|uniref:Exocyst complex component SEC5 n=1 Tax=Ceratopteris richardii TaxID=49495 RepID=A0A8T2SLQ5_CERRI|nr:hypothetical protein KP509_19G007800 [Ceratopteris richardii]